MRLLAIFGSPRKKGYSARFVEEAIAGYREMHPNAEVTSVYLNDLTMKGCQACRACKSPDYDVTCCVYEDDLKPVLHEMLRSDAVLFGVPNYMGNYNAQSKTMIDRFYGFGRSNKRPAHLPHLRLPPHQKTGIIGVQGDPDLTKYPILEEETVDIFGQHGKRPIISVTIGDCRGVDGSEAKPEDLQKAREIGRWLA